MSFDYYAYLAENTSRLQRMNEGGLAPGFVDACTVWSCQDNISLDPKRDPKIKAREHYISQLSDSVLQLQRDLGIEPDFTSLPNPRWIGVEVVFTLQTPWYSKDDRPFHVLDNPVRKDRVFGVPFMSASSWKGLLRWACRMQEEKFHDYLKENNTMENWNEPDWINLLFGKEKGKEQKRKQEQEQGRDKKPEAGTLVFHPTWFKKIGFQVINPHKRATRAGTNPIIYEVVSPGTTGTLSLLHAPFGREDQKEEIQALGNLANAVNALLTVYGFSAKRTAGWGAASVDAEKSMVWTQEGSWLDKLVGGAPKTCTPPSEEFLKLMDETGSPRSPLLDGDGNLLTKSKFRKLSDDEKPCHKGQYENFCRWYNNNGAEYKKLLDTNKGRSSAPETKNFSYSKFTDALKKLNAPRNGGAP